MKTDFGNWYKKTVHEMFALKLNPADFITYAGNFYANILLSLWSDYLKEYPGREEDMDGVLEKEIGDLKRIIKFKAAQIKQDKKPVVIQLVK